MKTPDTNYIEKLYRAYYMDVYSYLMTLVKDAHEAEELTQETFFRAMRSKSILSGKIRGTYMAVRHCKESVYGSFSKTEEKETRKCVKRGRCRNFSGA